MRVHAGPLIGAVDPYGEPRVNLPLALLAVNRTVKDGAARADEVHAPASTASSDLVTPRP